MLNIACIRFLLIIGLNLTWTEIHSVIRWGLAILCHCLHILVTIQTISTCVKIKRLWKWSFTVIQKKTRLNQICVIRLWLFSLTKNKPSPTVWVLIMLSAHASMMHQAHFLSRRRRRIRTKPKASLCSFPKDGERSEMS